MDNEVQLQRNNIERHLQTLIVVIVVGLLGWVGTTVQETQVAVAKLSVEIEFLKTEIQKPSSKFKEIEARLDRIESAINLHVNGNEQHSK